MSRFRADDLTLLLPAFERKARAILADLTALGYVPTPFDTLRTPAEAAKLHARGVGSRDSMHCYGVACDVICDRHGWDCAAKRCKFFAALGNVAERHGMVWGGRFASRHDLPHFQGCGSSAAEQKRIRAIGDPAVRDAYVAERLCK